MYNDDKDGVLDAGRGRPQSSSKVTYTAKSERLAPQHDRHGGVKRRTAVAAAREEDNEDGGGLTLTFLSSTKSTTELLRLPRCSVPVLTPGMELVP